MSRFWIICFSLKLPDMVSDEKGHRFDVLGHYSTGSLWAVRAWGKKEIEESIALYLLITEFYFALVQSWSNCMWHENNF